ncbi:glycosyl transferase [Aeromonas caviae]|uniref:glycosyltransferase n=2 Tax=Aeromonadaceae TaxID=84642 RepID=UPI000C34D2AC|nr:glycosyltransferase [Aeromonas hydrophila]PKD26077.1 putative glycosyl transferase [Aeromonas hydrophila]BBG84330.1 glycosyl transferase [Aeromonas hydrophila]BBT61652.1 glycosyl transferase [Aeromonas hydrophila]GKQ61895.1 glycosyl transferase [Aeromonas caviae]
MKVMKFSVVIPIYSGVDYDLLLSAVNSVTSNQTIRPYEVLIVSDGKGTEDICHRLQRDIKYLLKFLSYDKNRGPGFARDFGIRNATCEYVAIMDADDISLSERFELQIDEFKRNPNLSLCGGYIREYDFSCQDRSPCSIRTVPIKHQDICSAIGIKSPFNNVTVMFRKSSYILSGGYPAMRSSEDYYLWGSFISSGLEVMNIGSILVDVNFNIAAINRRRGLKYFYDDLKTQRHLYHSNCINLFRFVLNLIKYFCFRLMPAVFIKKIYLRVLRG